MSEPSAVEVIAEALHHSGDSRCPCTEKGEWWCSKRKDGLIWDIEQAERALAALKAAGFVVATRDEIRAMSAQEQAQLIGGVTLTPTAPDDDGYARTRVIGPWVVQP